MAATTIADIVQNTEFARYVQQETAERSAIIQSGIAVPDPVINELAGKAGTSGTTINMPFWNDISGIDSPLDESDIAIDKISAAQDVAVILRRAKGWGASDLSADLAGDDPAARIASRVAAYRARMRQKAFMAMVKGVFASNVANDGSDLLLDITIDGNGDAVTDGTEVLGRDTLLEAAQLLGDAKQGLTAIAMHSQAETRLNIIGGSSNLYAPKDKDNVLSRYNGFNIVMDDDCEFDDSTGECTIILFAAGACALNDVPEKVPFEFFRNAKGSQDEMYSRDAYVCHLRGVKWLGASMAKSSPSNTELALAANWSRVYERKHVRACCLKCKIA